MCFLRVQSQNLPRNLAFRDNQSRDGLSTEAAHCLEAMTTVGGPEATTGRDDSDDRVEKTSGLINDVGQSFVVRVGVVALKRRRLNLVDSKNRKQGLMPSKRIRIEAHHAAPSFLDRFRGFRSRPFWLF